MFDAPWTVPTILITLVLCVSGVAKLLNLSTASEAFVSLRLPVWLRKMKAPQLLPFGELALAAGLVVTSGWLYVLFALASVVLFLAYLAVIVRALSFNEPVTCSCFGKLGLGNVDRFTAIRNLILVTLSALVLCDAFRGRSVAQRLVHFSGTEWFWLAGVFCAVLLTWLISGHRGSTSVTTSSTNAVGTADDDDYLRVPTPFASLTRLDKSTVSLRELSRAEAVLLLFVSPTCGSCVTTIETARTWQHTVSAVHTYLVLPAPVSDTYFGLTGPDDFDILFDPQAETLRLFEGGTPTAVLLGADGRLAGGPSVGSDAISELMADIAEQLNGGENTLDENSSEETATAAPANSLEPSTPATASSASTHPVAAALGPAGAGVETVLDSGEDDYERRPTPYALLERQDGTAVPLISMADGGPVIFLIVNPGCGPCAQLVPKVAGWEERLHGIRITYIVAHTAHFEMIERHGADINQVLLDPHDGVRQMLEAGSPSLFAIGPDRRLLAGPVTGAAEIETTMEDIIAEVGAVFGEAEAPSPILNHSSEAQGDESKSAETQTGETRGSEARNDDAQRSQGAEGLAEPLRGKGDVLPATSLVRPDGSRAVLHGESTDKPRGSEGSPESADATGSPERLLCFISPGCDACHDVVARVPAWRDALPHLNIEVVAPGTPESFAALDTRHDDVQGDLRDDGHRDGRNGLDGDQPVNPAEKHPHTRALSHSVSPDYFDESYEFGQQLGVTTPALIHASFDGVLLSDIATGQAECYDLVSRLERRAHGR